MKRNKGIGNTLGSILAYQLMHRPADAPSKVVKSEQELRQEEFDRVRAEHERDWTTIDVPTTPYERSISGQAMKQVEVRRQEYEDRNGVTGLRKIWASSIEVIQAAAAKTMERVRLIDMYCPFPRSSQPVQLTDEDATKIMQRGISFLESKNLSADDKNRIVLFVSVHIESDSTIDAADPEIWGIAYRRLIELGAITVSQAPTLTQQTEPSADELAAEADSNYRDVALPLLSSWRSSLRANWGIELTDRLRDIAVDIMERHNLNPTLYESYDFVRIQMANRKLIRTDKTADGRPLTRSEFVADAIDRNNIDLSRPENKRWFMEQQDLILNGGE